ncbi:MAG: phosphatase PAP2 family protein [Treponema sp.]|nr:phosphatase PAP2 family protein [Treponema sp.]
MDYLYALQSLREAGPDFINYFFLFISEVIVKSGVLLVAIIFWSCNKQQGIIIGMSYVSAFSINQTVKNIACIPRPWLLDSRLHVDPLAEKGATGFSFPSGHTVTAASVFGQLSVWKRKNKGLFITSILIIILTAFSRNWLGCHTLKDVVFAVIVAGISLCLINFLVFLFSKHQDKDWLFCLTGCLLSIIILLIMQFKPYQQENVYPLITDCYTSCGMTCGMLVGWLLERRFVNFSIEVPVSTKVWRSLIGSLLILLLYISGGKLFAFMGDHMAHLAKYFLIFLVIIYIYPLIFNMIERRQK